LLRIVLAEAAEPAVRAGLREEELVMVETCIDDMNPEIFGYLMEKLFDDGALDVFWSPVHMKKNRPGVRVQVLCSPEIKQTAITRILSETTTLGVRYHAVNRICLERKTVEVQTGYGPVKAKQVTGADGMVRVVPEYEACRQIASQQGISLRQVYDAVLRAGGGRNGGFSNTEQHLDK
jgi:uncharacterized protein (DUF111 family)